LENFIGGELFEKVDVAARLVVLLELFLLANVICFEANFLDFQDYGLEKLSEDILGGHGFHLVD
jgi:hypothetical protein